MADVWKQSEGQIVAEKFLLQQYLAGTEHSAVFLTETSAPKPQRAAIKFIAADPTTADRQLSAWARAAHLTHPNLLRILDSGRCRLSRMDLLYVVLEYAEEDLSQVLPDRALTPSETRDMLGPLLDALTYLHGKNFVHSHISPANIHAIGDQLRLAVDTVFPAGDIRLTSRPTDVYDAPEGTGSPLSSSADVWSLGATLVEVLTQRAPELPLDNQSNPTFPESLPQPFLDIVRHALRLDPKSRWTLAEIRACMNPAAAAVAAGQTASATAAPSGAAVAAQGSAAAAPGTVAAVAPPPVTRAPEVATVATSVSAAAPQAQSIPTAKLPAPRYDAPPPRPKAPRQKPLAANASKQAVVLPNYVVPLLAVVLIIVAIIALPKILSRRADSSSSGPATPVQTAASSAPSTSTATTAKAVAPNSTKTPIDKKSSASKTSNQKTALISSPAPATTPAPAKASSSSSRPSRGDVLDQVLPDVSDKARATIQGRVRLSVRVHVDAAGNVTDAELASSGPSKYFADLSVKAARRWVFTPPEIDGRSVPSEWLIQFVFSQSDTKTTPTQTTP